MRKPDIKPGSSEYLDLVADGSKAYATKGRESLETWANKNPLSAWPTPTVTDKKRSGYGESSRQQRNAGVETTRNMGTTLTDAAVRGHGHPAPVAPNGLGTSQTADLNPRFVAALMGFPADWLETTGTEDFLFSEMPLFRSAPK
jgi:hypothetical protein